MSTTITCEHATIPVILHAPLDALSQWHVLDDGEPAALLDLTRVQWPAGQYDRPDIRPDPTLPALVRMPLFRNVGNETFEAELAKLAGSWGGDWALGRLAAMKAERAGA